MTSIALFLITDSKVSMGASLNTVVCSKQHIWAVSAIYSYIAEADTIHSLPYLPIYSIFKKRKILAVLFVALFPMFMHQVGVIDSAKRLRNKTKESAVKSRRIKSFLGHKILCECSSGLSKYGRCQILGPDWG